MMNIHKIKQEICDIGDRIYKKGFAAANDGNISYRVSEKEVVCTPTHDLQGLHEARGPVRRRHGRQAAHRHDASGPARSCCTWRS